MGIFNYRVVLFCVNEPLFIKKRKSCAFGKGDGCNMDGETLLE